MGETRIDTGGGAFVGGDVSTLGGNVVFGDYYDRSTKVYLPAATGESSREPEGVPEPGPDPYRPDRPFSGVDGALFAGREQETAQVLRQLERQQSLAIYGPADVGKSSLLAAAVLPALQSRGSYAISLEDYPQAVDFLRHTLFNLPDSEAFGLEPAMSLAQMVHALVKASSSQFVLVLDQFERFFMPDVDENSQDNLTQNLLQTYDLVEKGRFRVVVAALDDLQWRVDQVWGDLFPDLRLSPCYLEVLNDGQAEAAIVRPLALKQFPVSYSGNIVKRLLTDLDGLTGQKDGRIQPAELQILCQSLYEAALIRNQNHIDEALYDEITDGKGAARTINVHFNRLLSRLTPAHRPAARSLMGFMLDATLGFWVSAEQLEGDEDDEGEVETVLRELVDRSLLIWHKANGRPQYAFASSSIRQAVERAGGVDTQKRIRAKNELDYVWRAWVTEDTLASRPQLNYLTRFGPAEEFKPVPALLLLHSALYERLPPSPWLERLDTAPSRALLESLEDGGSRSKDAATDLTEQNQARRLLDMGGLTRTDESSEADLGQLSRTAVAHPKALQRETAVLSLTVLHGLKTPEFVAKAVDQAKQGRWRLAELLGMLAEGRSDLEDQIRDNPPQEARRFDIWWWRFRRRLSSDGRYIATATLGGGLGAGIGLGLLRAILSPLVGERPGFSFYNYFLGGFLLGAGLAFGLLLANPTRLKSEYGPGSIKERPLGRALLLGTAGFALVNLLLIILLDIRALANEPLAPLLAIIAGAGLSLAVHDQPLAGWGIGAGRWLLRLIAAAGAFALVQAAFAFLPSLGTQMPIGWSGFFYRRTLGDILGRLGFEDLFSLPDWFHYFALIDALLVGVVLTLGLTAGLIIGARRFEVWYERVNRAGE